MPSGGICDHGVFDHGDFEAVILAGGGSRRMNGADKPALEVGGVPMLVSVARAATSAGARRLIVVGPERGGAVADGLKRLAPELSRGLVTVHESPEGSGPVPALRRGLAEVTAPWLALLAADLPFLTGPWVTTLLGRAVAGLGGRGAVLGDAAGRPQWLAGCWRSKAVRDALERYGGQSLHGLLAPLAPALVKAPFPYGRGPALPPWLDCDDADALTAARALAADPDGEL